MKRTLFFIAVMAFILMISSLVSACRNETVSLEIEDSSISSVEVEAPSKNLEPPHTIPCIDPVNTEEKVLLDWILDEPYDVWLPGRLPQTLWLRNGEGAESTFVINRDTAVINHGVISFGAPNEEGTIYILCNLADAPAIREVCFNAELRGARRAVVCNIAVSRIAFENFVERRIESA